MSHYQKEDAPMPAPSSASTTVTTATSGGLIGGLLIVVTALIAGVTKTGFNLTDTLTALSGAGISVGSVASMAFHHSAALKTDAQVAVAAVPDLTKLRSDVDTVLPVVGDVNGLLAEIAPGWAAKIDAAAAKTAIDVRGLAAQVEASVGVTPQQVKTLARQALIELVDAVPGASPIPPAPGAAPADAPTNPAV